MGGRQARKFGGCFAITVIATALLAAPTDAEAKPVSGGIAHLAGVARPVKLTNAASAASTLQFPQPPVQYWGGPVLRTNETFVIFWDPAGQLSQSYRDLVVRYFADVSADHSNDNVYGVLSQYFDSTGPIANDSTYAGSLVNTDPFPAGCSAQENFPVCFTDDQLRGELDSFLAANAVQRTSNRGFFVFTPPGVNTCQDFAANFCATNRFCAYHSDAHGAHGDFLYALMPFGARPLCDPADTHPNGDAADATINLASHEHREMIDDPYIADATDFAPPLAWYEPVRGDETSDKCAYYFGPVKSNGVGEYNQVINGHQYLLQAEWSNALAADDGLGCVLNGSDTAPIASYTARVFGPRLLTDASGSRDPDPGDAIDPAGYAWDWGDGFITSGVLGQHRYAGPGHYHVRLYVTDSHGATDVEDKLIVIANPRPAPVHQFVASMRVNISDSLNGRGNATGMGGAYLASFGSLDLDGSDFPHSLGVSTASAFFLRANSLADQIGMSITMRLTDIADPPAGNNYTVSGSFLITSGEGTYSESTGSGLITGTCVSSFDRPDADCVLAFNGTISGTA